MQGPARARQSANWQHQNFVPRSPHHPTFDSTCISRSRVSTGDEVCERSPAASKPHACNLQAIYVSRSTCSLRQCPAGSISSTVQLDNGSVRKCSTRGVSFKLFSLLNGANLIRSLKKAQDDAASLTPEYVAANMAPEERKRLATVRNIGIAVRITSPRLLVQCHADSGTLTGAY